MRAIFGAVLGLLLGAMAPIPAEAQKVHRIEALVANEQFVPAVKGFKKKMEELGYAEGKSVQYGIHNAEGNKELLKTLALQVAQKKPDLIVTSSTTATAPIFRLVGGSPTPVVFLSAGNPLRFVKGYSSSGNNFTGISTSTIDLTEKRMELLKELVPGMKRAIALHNPKGENYQANLTATREAARKLGLQLVEVNLTSRDEAMRWAKGSLSRRLGDGLLHPPDALINSAIREMTPDLIREKLPSVAVNIGSVTAGALATYASDYFALGQQGAVMVDKIFKGVRPTDLPIEQPHKLHLVINMKTAKAIGLKISREILIRADEVIE